MAARGWRLGAFTSGPDNVEVIQKTVVGCSRKENVAGVGALTPNRVLFCIVIALLLP